ncbi:MAG TPA: hypothetical protein ENN03_09280 [bacterium]|nr:hypothetical protein [bacterium]
MGKKNQGMLDLLVLAAEHRKGLVIHFLIICGLTAGFSFIVPKTFRAETVLLPPVEDESMGMGSLLSQIPLSGFGFSLSPVSEETNIYIAILNSRTVMETVARRFDLQRLYRLETLEETVKQLRRRVTVKINDDATLAIQTHARTRWFSGKTGDEQTRNRCRDMANYFVSKLDSLNRRFKSQRASDYRIFIQERYHRNMQDLAHAEESFKAYQERVGAVALPQQTQATITAAAEMKARIMAKEIELEVLGYSLDSTHPDYIRVMREKRETERKYQEFIARNGSHRSLDEESQVFLSLSEVPDLGLNYLRLYREVLLQEKILELILPMLEQAKIQEARDTPTVQVLDTAVAPVKKIRPRRALSVIFAGLLSVFFSLTLFSIQEYFNKMRRENTEMYQKWIKVLELMKHGTA